MKIAMVTGGGRGLAGSQHHDTYQSDNNEDQDNFDIDSSIQEIQVY